jgi:hypothetical protein
MRRLAHEVGGGGPLRRSLIFLIFTLQTLVTGFGCGQSPSHRESEKKQIESNVKEAKIDISPALGRFEGPMLMYAANKRYDTIVESALIYKVIPSPVDPTQYVSVPKISGYLTFAVLRHQFWERTMELMDLLRPMAFYSLVSFTSGDYDPETHDLNLPYSIPDRPNTVWGELQGKLIGGVFSGTWRTRTDGVVGEFSLIRVSNREASK